MAESRPRRGLLVYNPQSGSAGRRPDVAGVVARAARRGLDLLPLPTERPRHATELVAARLGEALDLVAVAGGDGTVGEVAEALLGTDVPVAILPTGTANVVAREYGIGRTVAEGERALTSSRAEPITVWRAAGRTCLISAGVGFDARVMKNIVPVLKRLFGRTGIAWTATMEWLKYEFPPIEVTGVDAEGASFSVEATFAVAANTRRYGGDAIVSPFADPSDDLLDLVLFGSRSRWTLMRWYGRLSRGKAAHLSLEGCSRRAVRSFTARSRAKYELDVQIDGDALTTTPFAMGPAAGRVRIVVPE
ncbi:MAG TPA: diacylglycerol kinase family protein [Thermoanaerobaculia bacterium]|nr:diacylglycerol kinase family protein [Thermoanaerobaculia bacterium]